MNAPSRADLAHLLDDHKLTFRDVSELFGCREDLLRDLIEPESTETSEGAASD